MSISPAGPPIPSPMDVKPSWWYASIGVLLALSGVGLFAYFLVTGIAHLTDSLTQVVVPGHTDLRLTQTGTYTIFLEENSVVSGRIYSVSESVDGLRCAINKQGRDEQSIPVQPSRGTIHYSVNQRSGRSLWQFVVTESGSYTFACGYPEGLRGPQVVVAVGTGVGRQIWVTVMRSLASMFGGFGLCGIVIVLVYFLREKSKKQLAT